MSSEAEFNDDLNFLASLRKAREDDKAKAEKYNLNRDEYISNVSSLTKDIAVRTQTLLPPNTKLKKPPLGGGPGHQEVDNAFSDSNPMKGVGSQVMSIISSLQGRKLKGDISGEAITDLVFNKVMEERLPAAWGHKLKQETSIFGEDTGNVPGYEEFRKDFDEKNRPDISAYYKGLTPKGIATNLGIAAGGNIALEAVGQVAKKAGWRLGAKAVGRGLFGLPAVGAPGLIAKGAGLALMAAADFAMFDAASAVVSESKWAKAREDEPFKVLGAEAIAGLGGSAVMAPRLAKSLKTMAFDKVHNEAAAKVLEKTGTVNSLMEYDRSVKRLGRSKKVSTEEMDSFVSKNKSTLEKFALEKEFQAYDPSVPGGYGIFNKNRQMDELVSGYDPALPGSKIPGVGDRRLVPVTPTVKAETGVNLIPEVTERSLAVRKTIGTPQRVAEDSWLGTTSVEIHDPKFAAHTPLLEAPNSYLALPAPVEKFVGSNISLRGRVAMRTAYEHNSGLNRATVIMGEHGPPELRPEAITKITEFFTYHQNVRKIPDTLLGPEFASATTEINSVLAKDALVPRVTTATEKALSSGMDSASHGEKLKVLDAAGVSEVKELGAEGIPTALAVPLAAAKSVARKVRGTSILETRRNSAILSATDADVVWARTGSSSIIRRSKSTSEGLTVSDEAKLMEKGAEKSVVTSTAKVGDVAGKLSPEELARFKLFQAAKARQKRGALSRPDKSLEESLMIDADLMEMAAGNPDISSLVKKGLITVPLAAVAMLALDGNEAEAGVLGSVSMLGAELAKKAAGDASAGKLIETLRKSGMVGEKGTILGQVKKWQEGLSMNPTVESIKSISSRIPSAIRNFVMTPGAVADSFYKGDKNPLVELATRMTAMHNNVGMHSKAVKEILAMVPEYKNVSGEVRKAMRPLVDQYDKPLAVAGYHEGMVAELGKRYRLINKKKNPEEYAAALQDMKDNHVKLRDAKEAIKGYEKDWTNTVQGLAKQHSSTRISLALEDTAEFVHYPWLKGMMTPSEMSAVSMLKDLNKVTEGRIVNAGGLVIKDRPFAHHAIHPDSNRKVLQEVLEGSTVNAHDALNLARLNSRSIGSKMMMPDIEYMFQKYIPDVERRVQTMEFWKKGKEGGWSAHQRDLRANNLYSPEIKEFWKGINESFGTTPQTGPAEWAKRYYSLEVLWRLFASPSVGFKHAMKQVGNLAIFPTDVWAKGVSRAPGLLFRMHLEDLKAKWPKTFSGVTLKQSDEVDLVRAYTNQGKYNSAIAEMDMFDAPINKFDKVLDWVNQKGSVIVGTVEAFDRASTVIMGMEMAAKKGMTPSQATFAVYDSILKANFLSGVHNPVWVRDPHARAFFMFQGTPFKLAEQRFIQAAKAGKDIAKAGQVTWEELKGLKMFMKEGEARIKYGMIADALTATKDIYGQSVTKQFAVNMLTIGGLIGAGDKFFDSDIHDQVFHLPFFKIGGESPGLMLNPVVGAGYKTWTKRHEEDRDLLFTEFINNWAGGSGVVPSSINKAMRLTENDIPEIYRGSKFRYFFGVGASKE